MPNVNQSIFTRALAPANHRAKSQPHGNSNMADIQFYQEENEDGQDDGDDSGLGIDDDYGESYNPDEGLTPIQKLEKYINSDSLYSRQMVARSLLETIRVLSDNEEDSSEVLSAMVRLADDPEPAVRTELMEQVPHIAMYCHENSQLFVQPVPNYILPIIVKYLMDNDNQVRKTSQAALLVLMEQGLIHNVDIEEHVCPVILNLSSPESIDDFRTEAVALMSKMAPLIGKDITERVFMPRFAEMCTDALFQVRKVCAANFGDMCSVVGQENTEDHLLPKFFYLCEDGVWGVRKACAECFMQVSCSTSPNVRHGELAQLFVGLLYDASRWVRMAAFTSLGGFISTFADPSITGLYFDEEGILTVGNPDDFKKDLDSSSDEIITYSSDINEKNSESTEVQQSSENTDLHESPPKDTDNLKCLTDTPLLYTEEDMDIEENKYLDNPAQDNKPAEILTEIETSPEEKRAETYTNKLVDSVKSTDELNSETSCSNAGENNPAGQEVNKVGSAQSRKSELQLNLINKSSPCDKKGDTTSPESFSSFLYWREPLRVVDLDAELTPDSELEIDSKECSSIATVSMLKSDDTDTSEFCTDIISGGGENTSLSELHLEDLENETETFDSSPAESSEENRKTELKIHTANVSTVTHETDQVENFGSMHVLGQQVSQRTMTVINGIVQDIPSSNFNYCPIDDASSSLNSSHENSGQEQSFSQDVIPQALLDHYLSMTNPARAQTVDAEIARHCAYSLPAVAYTLGRKNWPCLRELYEQLAGDMQWKVRRTLAFSIHELAVIVGSEITCRDLVSVFDGFLRDLDEVRIGVLKHLADFLRLLPPEIRKNYLPKIHEFQATDNQRNWRFREELALQIILLLDLCEAEDISHHLVSVALDLAEDGVSAVRTESFRVVACMLKKFSMAEDKQIPIAFVNDIIGKFAHNTRWNRRQYYLQICTNILEERALPEEKFATDMLPSFLALGKDAIPNVRITLAAAISRHLLNSEYFTSAQNPHHEDLLTTIQQLKSDKDKDVRYFISYQPQTDLGDLDTIPV